MAAVSFNVRAAISDALACSIGEPSALLIRACGTVEHVPLPRSFSVVDGPGVIPRRLAYFYGMLGCRTVQFVSIGKEAGRGKGASRVGACFYTLICDEYGRTNEKPMNAVATAALGAVMGGGSSLLGDVLIVREAWVDAAEGALRYLPMGTSTVAGWVSAAASCT